MKNKFLFALLSMSCLCNFSVAGTEIVPKTYIHDDEFMTIFPIYWDPASIEEYFTTEACNKAWNGEAFSHVWPQSRKELTNLILDLRRSKNNFHNIHVIAILDSQDANIFKKNLDNLRESVIISSLLEIPLAVSIAEEDTYTMIQPAHIGPDSQRISIYPTHIEWMKEDGETIVSDFEETKHILRNLISAKKENDFSLWWIPAQSNVNFLLELLKQLHENNCSYSFELYL